MDPPLDGAGFVEGEIHSGVVAHQQQDFFETVFRPLAGAGLGFGMRTASPGSRQRGFSLCLLGRSGPSPHQVGMADDMRQFFGDVLRRENEIHAAGRDGTARHRVVFGRFILGKANPRFSSNRFQSQRPVRGGAGEDYANRPLAPILGQRLEKKINRPMRPGGLRARLKFQSAVGDDHGSVGRNDIHVVGLDWQVVTDLAHRHRSSPGQKLSQRAGVRRIQMLHQHKTHAGVGRQMLQQLCEGLQPASGCANAHDRKPDCRPHRGYAGADCGTPPRLAARWQLVADSPSWGACLGSNAREQTNFRFGLGHTPRAPDAQGRNCFLAVTRFHWTAKQRGTTPNGAMQH